MTKIHCLACGELIIKKSEEAWARFRDRKFCTKACASKLAAERARTRRCDLAKIRRYEQRARWARRFVPWPYVTGEIETSFHQHNHDPGDIYGSVGLPSATLVPKGSSADL